jgi:hypothetical protein
LCPSEVSRGRFLGSEGPGVTPAGPPTKIILDVNPNRSEDVQEKVRLADKKTPCFGRQKNTMFWNAGLGKIDGARNGCNHDRSYEGCFV